MPIDDPLAKPRTAVADLINRLGAKDSPVGIDAPYTHAVIIDFLRQIAARLETIEQRLDNQQN
jgi:hypothetical protein